ncbi:MAG: sel1 repeat family protein [Desulfuromonadales bacterium]|nr:sel1 repeat family protein [Desulfuromonadales bacterium]MBN2792103.1 sel1 repeat family protein [Desulfuromonadales bacterium]
MRQLKNQALSGDPESQYQLGIHYTTNGQWTWNSARGYGWFLEAAESGHVDAQYMVGMSQLLGRGTEQDESGALVWLIRAAEQGLLSG